MKKGLLITLIVIAAILLIGGITVVSTYNGMLTKSEEVDGKFADIDNELQRRANLIPNLVNTVKATTDLVETKKPEGENPGETPEDKIVKTEEKQDEHSVAVEIPTKVIVHHYIYNKEKDEYTTIKVPSVTAGQVVQDEEITGLVGENYTTAKSNQVARNYEVVNETPDKHEGMMTKTPIEVTYYYQLKDETVTSEITKTAKADKTIERETLLYVELPSLVNRILHLSLLPLPTNKELLEKEVEEVKKITNTECKSVLSYFETNTKNVDIDKLKVNIKENLLNSQ